MKISIMFIVCLFVGMFIVFNVQEFKFGGFDKSLMDVVYYLCCVVFLNYLEEDDVDCIQQIKVFYCCLMKNDWVIFGEFVFYGQDWCLGVNEVIEVIFFQLVEIGGIYILVGIYIMFVQVYVDYWVIKVFIECFIGGFVNCDVMQDIVVVLVSISMVLNVCELFIIGF